MTLIYVATSNPGKLADFAAAARQYGVNIQPLPGIDRISAPAETGNTFEENACLKAEYYSRLAREQILIADDSGLTVEALNGDPGVRSARYAEDAGLSGEDPDTANNQLLLERTEGIPDSRRRCAFVCSIAAARAGKILKTFTAEAVGVLLRAPRGNNGFGYDPLFYFPELSKTFAEISREEKLKVSHRGKAFGLFLDWNRRDKGRLQS